MARRSRTRPRLPQHTWSRCPPPAARGREHRPGALRDHDRPRAHRRTPRLRRFGGHSRLATPGAASPSAESGALRAKRPKCALRRILERQRAHRESRHRRSEPVFSSSATHSTWCVIGNRSKARSSRQRVAVLGEDRDVAGQRGRVAGDVRHRARGAVDDLLDDRAAGALARRVEDDEVERLVVRRARAPGRRRRARRATPRAGRLARACWQAAAVALDGHHPAAGPTASARKRGEQPDAGVEVEHPLPRLRARARPARSRPAPRGARGAPARSRRPATAKSWVPHGVSTVSTGRRRLGASGARDQAVVDRDHARASGACASPGGRRAAAAYRIRVRQRRPSLVAGHRLDDDRRRRARRAGRSCSRTTAALSVALRGQRDVLEVAAAAQPGPGVRARRRRPGPATASSTSTASPRQKRSPSVPSVISTTTRSPGSACRTKTTRASRRRASRATQWPPWATGPTSTSNRSPTREAPARPCGRRVRRTGLIACDLSGRVGRGRRRWPRRRSPARTRVALALLALAGDLRGAQLVGHRGHHHARA